MLNIAKKQTIHETQTPGIIPEFEFFVLKIWFVGKEF